MQEHSLKKSTAFAQDAFKRINKEALSPTPKVFELWYVYYSKESAEITRAIDIFISKAQRITDDQCLELHQRFLGEKNEAQRIRETGDRIQETIKDVSGIVDSTKTVTTKYSESLGNVSDKLDANAGTEDLKAVLETVKTETDSVLAHNENLELQLARSVQAMTDLQEDLNAVRKEAMTDALTQLSNRKAFDEKLEELIEKIDLKEYETFSLLLMDIDHFKNFNDTFGHLVGDQVLKLVGKTMVDSVKGRDTVARYGGEEFAVLLPDTSSDFSLRVGDNLRIAISGKEIINRSTGEKIASITLSGGVAEFIKDESPEDIIERADKALYAAKNSGRNRIIIAS